jgi:hypothetical protein
MAEGERFVLVREDLGGGWAEVERDGKVASVPASYVQAVYFCRWSQGRTYAAKAGAPTQILNRAIR